MLKMLSRLKPAPRGEIRDAGRIYQKTMQASRNPVFYGVGKCADTTSGRMEILCLHLSCILYALRTHGENGEKLTQAIYDVMVADFDTALREEGLSDSGVVRRIKPLAGVFYARAKTYGDAMIDSTKRTEALTKAVGAHICKTETANTPYIAIFVGYIEDFMAVLGASNFGEIASTSFEFPSFPQ